MMNNPWELVGVALAGGFFALLFYGGLYFTVAKGLRSPRPALWFFSSIVLRMSSVVGGFYLINDGSWQRLMVCFIGFVVIGGVFRFCSKVFWGGGQLKRELQHSQVEAAQPLVKQAREGVARDAS
jgi:F1F0 ATPase subunit 2